MSPGDLYAIAAGFFWSFSVILMRISGYTIPPLPLTFFKSFITIIGCAILLIVTDGPWLPELAGMTWLRLIISAILGISIADTLFAAALNRLGASLQAIADCMYAPAVTFVGFLLFGETLTASELLGGSLVVSGVFVGLVRTPEIKEPRDLVIGTIFAVGSHVIMAVGILMVRDVIREGSTIWVAGLRFAVATVALGAFALLTGQRKIITMGFKRRDTWKYTIPMAMLGPFLATLFWMSGFKYETVGRAAIYNQMSTVFIILLAWLVLKEQMTLRKWIGVGLAVSGALWMGWAR